MNNLDEHKFGLVHIYCGDGKGKTTAAVGLCVRAVGSGAKVVFAQFLKGAKTSEINILQQLPQITIIRSQIPLPFTFNMNEQQRLDATIANNNILQQIIDCCNLESVNVLVFDELCAAYNKKLIDVKKVDDFLQNRPPNLEIIITGRNPPQHFIEMADYVSEITKIKHPYEKGVSSRKGIEF